MVSISVHVAKCIEKVAAEKKLSFVDAAVFLIKKVLAP